MTRNLGSPLESELRLALERWDSADGTRRLWSGDATLWTGSDEASWLGWLDAVKRGQGELERLREFAASVVADGFTHAMLLGMGGSSLCPDVLSATFGRREGHPELIVLDSTDPGQIARTEAMIDPGRTLAIVSSKSGSTLEPNILMQYFLERLGGTAGQGGAPARFVAITDPGSKLEATAGSLGFRQVFAGVPGIGGRYSALSNFGLVPAAIMGIDLEDFLERTGRMVLACGRDVAAGSNPGVALGAILGVAQRAGRDKVTLWTSPGIRSLGAWLEQLLAESTGKQGKALIPVDEERPGAPGRYGEDRLFVYLRLETGPDAAQDAAAQMLEQAGQPLVRIAVADVADLGQEFFRWEIATAVAGSLMGINPFNQPDVEASKIASRRLTEEYEKNGRLPAEEPFARDGGLSFIADDVNSRKILELAGGRTDAVSVLSAHLGRLEKGDYAALLAYIDRNERHQQLLQSMRHAIRDRARVATCLGYGPRFLHSTGQAYKGGPDTGVFVQITCDDAVDLDVPGKSYTFGVAKAAQARGDFEVLAERGRRALRIHIGGDTSEGLARLNDVIATALQE